MLTLEKEVSLVVVAKGTVQIRDHIISKSYFFYDYYLRERS